MEELDESHAILFVVNPFPMCCCLELHCHVWGAVLHVELKHGLVVLLVLTLDLCSHLDLQIIANLHQCISLHSYQDGATFA